MAALLVGRFRSWLSRAGTSRRLGVAASVAASLLLVAAAVATAGMATSSPAGTGTAAAASPRTGPGGSAATVTGSPTATAASGTSTGTVRLSDVLPGLSAATLLGASPADTPMTIDVGLASPDAAAERAAISAEYDPSSPAYHHFLTPAVFDARFGVARATVAATESWLRSGGLRVGYVSPAGDLVSAVGTTAQVAALMGTSFARYRIGSVSFVANQAGALVPAGLPITAVAGLNTLQRVYTEPELQAAAGHPPAVTTPAASTAYVGTLVNQDLWGVYDAPASDTGQGETAGVFMAGYSNGVVADLRVFEQRRGLAQVPIRTVAEPTAPSAPGNDGDVVADDEWNLDTQAVDGMAPGLSGLDLYVANTESDADTAVMFDDWANDPNGPKQMNASFGECESTPLASDTAALSSLAYGQGLVGQQLQVLSDPSLEQAVAEGRTLFSAAGDTAGSCPAVVLPVIGGGNGVLPQPAAVDAGYPCASTFSVCVGGTVVTTNGTTDPAAAGAPSSDGTATATRVAETAWAFTGGGPALDIPAPAYQQGVAAIDEPCVSPLTDTDAPIQPGAVCRGTPDVAAMSGTGLVDGLLAGSNAYLTNIDMMPVGSGGTSLSSPLTVGMWSRIQAASPAVGGVFGGLGFANETFYAVGKGPNATRDFFDVTQNELPVGNVYHQAGAGWDYASGWGAVDVANFIRDVDGDAALAPTHPSVVSVPGPASVCAAELTSPVGNAVDGLLSLPVGPATDDPQLDITAATLGLSADGTDLVATISGPGLSTDGPVDAVDGYNFYVTWTDAGTTYFAGAAVDQPVTLPATPLTNSIPAPLSLPIGTVTFGDGVLDSAQPEFTHADQGSFTSAGGLGTFTIVVPLANVGAPGAGAQLQYPFAFDTLPDGVLVPFAMDEAAPDPAGLQVVIGPGC